MKILLTGSTGYIGKRLLPYLLGKGHHVVCLVRDKKRFTRPQHTDGQITLIEGDLLSSESLREIPNDIQVAYYLVHSMSSHADYTSFEKTCATNFQLKVSSTSCEQVIYLGGILNDSELSDHLNSRKNVELELSKGSYHITSLRAGIIIGSGSASFEIMRDLVEKLPIMITPKWLMTRCQPIGISDVLLFLYRSALNPDTYDKHFDIGCNDVLTYKEMLLIFAKVRNLRRYIWTVPVLTPKLSSYWLYFVTSTSFRLARSLVDSMKIEVVCQNNDINTLLDVAPISYKDSLIKAFNRTQKNEIVSTWKDSYSSSDNEFTVSDFIEVPIFGCFKDQRTQKFVSEDKTIDAIWSIGGDKGWFHGNWLWKVRGYLDKLFGGVGLRRGRRSQTELNVGDPLDFWRVLYANKEEGHLLLFAEMKLPGEAWLEFKIEGTQLKQTATFRPLGLAGRLYWYSVVPLHGYIFNGMLNKLSKTR